MGHNQVDLADNYQASYRVGLENVNIHMMILTKLTYLVSWLAHVVGAHNMFLLSLSTV